jgi:hypothetical protein
MLHSTSEILNYYLDSKDTWRTKVYSVEMERGDNPEDLYYLCHIEAGWFVVYETDYLAPLPKVAREATEIFEPDGVRLLHWLTKKDSEGVLRTLPLEAVTDESVKDSLVLDLEGSYLRYVVLAAEVAGHSEKRYNPNVYGFAK